MTVPALPLASKALALTVQDWQVLGMDTSDPATAPTDDVNELVERITALLLVRCVAVVEPLGKFPDLSTSNICRTVLMKSPEPTWPAVLTEKVIQQLRELVRRMVVGYKQQVPYHNREHAFHVVLSMNKLMDMMLSHSRTTMTTTSPKDSARTPPRLTFGLKYDAVALLSLLWAALIHDVEHQGIPNRQLAVEDDRLAVLYNDQSIAENWSLYVAFSEFLQDEFQDLRQAIFPPDAAASSNTPTLPETAPPAATNSSAYRLFRKHVINLVLTTDIASPERTQIAKSKWKEAFGDPFETMQRKMLHAADIHRRMSLTGQELQFKSTHHYHKALRRGTGDVSELSYDGGLPMGGGGGGAMGSQLHGPGEEGEHDDDSLTPENSFHEDEGMLAATPGGANGAMPLPADQLAGLPMASNSAPSPTSNLKFDRRLSTASSRQSATSKYRYRLGIRRTVDLSGETLENYQPRRSSSMSVSVHSNQDSSCFPVGDLELDEPDDLKATVVMETLMHAADVAHNLQGWEAMVKWSSRLYLELRKAHVQGRGGDPEPKWFENQIGFLESYLLPLAHRLEDTGVFPPDLGPTFATLVEENRDAWLIRGHDITDQIVQDGAQLYPGPAAPPHNSSGS